MNFRKSSLSSIRLFVDLIDKFFFKIQIFLRIWWTESFFKRFSYEFSWWSSKNEELVQILQNIISSTSVNKKKVNEKISNKGTFVLLNKN